MSANRQQAFSPELTSQLDSHCRVELSYFPLINYLGRAKIYVIILDPAHHERKIFRGVIRKKDATAVMHCLDEENESFDVHFEKKKHGGLFYVPSDVVHGKQFFLRLEGPGNRVVESYWQGKLAVEPKKHRIALIPCYNVVRFCHDVIQESLNYVDEVIVVDDGSDDGTTHVIRALIEQYGERIHLIRFDDNRGKGHALIAGYSYALEKMEFDTIVTLDGDGQHLPQNITHLLYEMDRGAEFVVGGRNFALMPFRSKFSNHIISFLLRLVYAKAPVDTQSGMRAFSWFCVRDIVNKVPGGAYETEFRCLLRALKFCYKTVSVTIPTVYIDKNRSSHFALLTDSLKILWVFFRYGFTKK